MATIDASIPLQVKPIQFQTPFEMQAQMGAIQQGRNQNRLSQMQFAEAERAGSERNALSAISKQYGNTPEFSNRLHEGGFTEQAQKQEVYEATRETAKVARNKAKFEFNESQRAAAAQRFGALRGQPYEAVVKDMQDGLREAVESGAKTQEEAEQIYAQMLTTIPRDQAGLDAFISQKIDSVRTPEQMVASANKKRDDAYREKNDEANRAATRENSLRTDRRARESNESTLGKPFEVTLPDGTPTLVRQDKQGNISRVEGYGPKAGTEKAMTDSQSKAALFGSRMEASDKIITTLFKGGTGSSIPGSRTGFGIGSAITAMSSDKQQSLDQAKRDYINAVLRRESGAVIADSEFDNAEKQYFPQIGDGKETLAQKARNRAIAVRGVQAEVPKAHLSTLRKIIDGETGPDKSRGGADGGWSDL